MSAQLQNVILPGEHDRAAFNCNEQQVMTLSYYYEKEYWKLFLGKIFSCNSEEKLYMEDALIFDTKTIDMAAKHYGIIWEEIKETQQLTFDNDEIYFVNINTKYYPFTSNIEQEGEHCFLIYGMTEEEYLVNDNFYNVAEFNLEKELYEKSEKKVFLITKRPTINYLTNNNVLTQMKFDYHAQIMKFIQWIQRNDRFEYHSAPLLDKFQMIYAYIKKDIVILENSYGEDDYIKICMSILQDIADNVKKFWCSFLKLQIKHSTIPKDVFIEKLGELEHNLFVERRVKEEVTAVISNANSLKDKLHEQLLVYSEKNEVDDTRSVYEDHEKYAVMYLLSYWEDQNQIQELDYLLYKNMRTYGEYKRLTYQLILRDGL